MNKGFLHFSMFIGVKKDTVTKNIGEQQLQLVNPAEAGWLRQGAESS